MSGITGRILLTVAVLAAIVALIAAAVTLTAPPPS